MSMRLQFASVAVAPNVRCLVFVLEGYSRCAPIILLARHVDATFQHEHALSCRRKPIGQRSPAGATSDYDDVVMIFAHSRSATLQHLQQKRRYLAGARTNLAQWVKASPRANSYKR